jgi:hypothetical protein
MAGDLCGTALIGACEQDVNKPIKAAMVHREAFGCGPPILTRVTGHRVAEPRPRLNIRKVVLVHPLGVGIAVKW